MRALFSSLLIFSFLLCAGQEPSRLSYRKMMKRFQVVTIVAQDANSTTLLVELTDSDWGYDVRPNRTGERYFLVFTNERPDTEYWLRIRSHPTRTFQVVRKVFWNSKYNRTLKIGGEVADLPLHSYTYLCPITQRALDNYGLTIAD